MMSLTATSQVHPALNAFSEMLPLRGFSGALVCLVRQTDGWFVRKAAASLQQNDRLKRQALRQTVLRRRLEDVARVPDIFSDGYAEGLYFFDMQFIAGFDAATYVSRSAFCEAQAFCGRIENILTFASRTPSDFSTESFSWSRRSREKHDEIQARLRKSVPEEILTSALRALTLPDECLRPTLCHGDLTLENIIVDRSGELWLIDANETVVEHFWMDVSKLFQDLEGQWFLRRGTAIGIGRRMWLLDRIRSHVNALAPGYADCHNALMALTFARILPYALSKLDQEVVLSRIRYFLSQSQPVPTQESGEKQ